MIRSIMENRPVRMCCVMVMEDGTAVTGYYGDCCPEDMWVMAYHLQMDAIWTVTKANASEIVRVAEEQEEEDNAG